VVLMSSWDYNKMHFTFINISLVSRTYPVFFGLLVLVQKRLSGNSLNTINQLNLAKLIFGD